MKQCIALAGLLCLLASGCAQSGLMGRRGAGEAGYLTTSRNAPRPLITRDASRPNGRLLGKSSANGVELCGCDVGCANGCSDGCGHGCGNCNGCASGGPCGRLAERIASGFCGPCGPGGVCPHGGGYPEYPSFNPGPPTGQVAYPYYTTRGPRDFLRDKPPSIGPY